MPKISQAVDSGAYTSPSETLSKREALNLMPTTPMVDGGVASGGLTSLPGSDAFANLGETNPAGSHVFNGELYVMRQLNGLELHLVPERSSPVVVGSDTQFKAQIADKAIFADNGVVMCIVFPLVQLAYFYDSVNGLVEITDSVFVAYQAEATGVQSVAFIDGYFAFNTHESIFISSLVTVNDGKNFDASDFVKPFLRENCIRLLSVRGELMAFGDDRSKTYSNIGGADFPFVEIPGATIMKGIEEPHAAIEFDNSYFFLGGGINERKAVWRGVGGGGVTKVSTDFIDRLMSFGFDPNIGAFMLEGRPLLAIDTDGGGTKVYDILSSSIKGVPVWINWSAGTEDNDFEFANITEAYEKIFVDARPSLTFLDMDIGGLFGEGPRQFTFSGAYLQDQSDALIINRLELVMETGIGLDREESLTDLDPEVLLEYSDDGGRTYKNAGTRKIGRNGVFNQRLVWTRLGRSPTQRIFRFTCTTRLPLNFNRVDLQVEGTFRNA